MCADKIIDLITEFSDRYQDDEIKELNIKLARKLSDKVSFCDDKPELWAGGIIYAICQLNFLFDKVYVNPIHRLEVSYYFSILQQKLTLKARDIRRLLKLKLGDKEFSTEFISSLNIPEDDIDFKRIRIWNEVKHQLFPNRQSPDVNLIKNSELERLFDKILKDGESEENLNELYALLRPAFFIELKSGLNSLRVSKGDKFSFAFFTRLEKCQKIIDKFDDNLEPCLWAFFNLKYYINSENFDGIVFNPESDNIFVSKDKLRNVYPNHDKINYYNVFFFR